MTPPFETVFSTDRCYRYSLFRNFNNEHNHFVQFIGLNPSTADETKNDPTVRRCIGFAKRWNFGGMLMSNIFAWRATNPAVMMAQADPIGPENNGHLIAGAKAAGLTIIAWGQYGSFDGRGPAVLRLMKNHGIVLHCLTVNSVSQTPAHPLYQPGNLQPRLWPGD